MAFELPSVDAPRVSIIIPVYGKVAYTLACLRSLVRHRAQASFEVIVVDDASPDDSATTLAQITGLHLLRHTDNLGFIGSCNAGAAAARGEFLLFLNNDTQVTPGWLDALLQCFAERSDCGIAGGRLLYPDGRLQEAGGVVFADGSCWNTGRFEPRDDPAFRYRRETDYVSGAALLIRKATFEHVGGFDTRYAPAYYEDVDLAFAVRQLDLRVYYEPASTVIHCEGISAGTDLDRGMKQHQQPNQAKFAAKWQAALTAQPPTGTPLARAIRWHRRGRVLVVDAMTPEPSRDSGSMRMCAILELLDRQGWSTALLPDDGHATAHEMATLGALGCETLCRPTVPDLPRWLARHGR
ncbi:MAG: glycosyltransferase family 2 protein, partial [Rhodanobacter sp.]